MHSDVNYTIIRASTLECSNHRSLRIEQLHSQTSTKPDGSNSRELETYMWFGGTCTPKPRRYKSLYKHAMLLIR